MAASFSGSDALLAVLALYLTGKKFVTASETMAGKCAAPLKEFAPDAKADWNGWGVDPTNSRFQPNPGLSAADVPRLKLKWAFGYPKETLTPAQPTVVGGRIFMGTLAGNVYSLDAFAGCTIWSFSAGAGVRTAITVAAAKTPGKYVVYFGDLRVSAHALDAETGQELWKTRVDDHRAARLTGAPALYNGTLYVPVSSSEEALAASVPTNAAPSAAVSWLLTPRPASSAGRATRWLIRRRHLGKIRPAPSNTGPRGPRCGPRPPSTSSAN
jgi:polyvinyl alcohol dehydrogenase (cytochrome)